MRKMRLLLALGLALMLSFGAQARVVNLSELAENQHFEAQNNDTLTGKISWMTNPLKLTIAGNSTVMLDNVDIVGKNSDLYPYAGITLLGDVTLIIKGENRVIPFRDPNPAIYVPAGKTLWIAEDPTTGGTLNATCSKNHTCGAGIGGGEGLDCGTIVIQSGVINATGSLYGPGIGGGKNAKCEGISIYDATVTATGGQNAAGIGSGENGQIISGGIYILNPMYIKATGGTGAPYSIGMGKNGTNPYGVTINAGQYVDGVPANPYEKDSRKVYTAFDAASGVLTYYYDHRKVERTQTELYDPESTNTRFANYHDDVKKAVIDHSMKEYAPTSFKYLFYGTTSSLALSQMTAIEGLQYLNTSNAKSLYGMFYCCFSLKELDLTTFDVYNVTDINLMFAECRDLTTIYCNDNWPEVAPSTLSGAQTFDNCTDLVGGAGTKYKTEYRVYTYARPDSKGTSGFFTSITNLKDKLYHENWLCAASELKDLYDFAGYFISESNDVRIALSNAEKAAKAMANNADATMPELVQAIQDANDVLVAQGTVVASRAKTGLLNQLNNMGKEDDSDAVKKIISDAVTAVNAQVVWDNELNVNAFKTRMTHMANYVNSTIPEDVALKRANEKLNTLRNEMQYLYDYAEANMVPATELAEYKAAIDNATAALSYTASAAMEAALSEAETAYKQGITKGLAILKQLTVEGFNSLLKEGDSEACKKIIADANAAVNAFEWDYNETAANNVWAFDQLSNYSMLMQLKSDLEAQRKAEQTPTGIDEILKSSNTEIIKTVRDGQVVILRNGKMYNLIGTEMQ